MIIGIVGALGAGKGTVVEYLKAHGYRHYSGSGYLKEVLMARGVPVNRDAYSQLAGEIRTKDPQGLVKVLYERYRADGGGAAVIEALHDIGEVEFIKSVGGVVLAIDAPLQLRYDRAIARGSEKDNISFEHFKQQIEREENGGGHHNIRAAMKLADYTLMNDSTLEELHQHVAVFLKKFLPTQD
jgi:dephospho-CoA kinase